MISGIEPGLVDERQVLTPLQYFHLKTELLFALVLFFDFFFGRNHIQWCSGITSDRTLGTICGDEDQTWISCMSGKHCILSSISPFPNIEFLRI